MDRATLLFKGKKRKKQVYMPKVFYVVKRGWFLLGEFQNFQLVMFLRLVHNLSFFKFFQRMIKKSLTNY